MGCPVRPLEEEGAAEEQAAGAGGDRPGRLRGGRAALWDQSVTLSVLVGDQVQEMTLGDYLWGGGGGGDARQFP